MLRPRRACQLHDARGEDGLHEDVPDERPRGAKGHTGPVPTEHQTVHGPAHHGMLYLMRRHDAYRAQPPHHVEDGAREHEEGEEVRKVVQYVVVPTEEEERGERAWELQREGRGD